MNYIIFYIIFCVPFYLAGWSLLDIFILVVVINGIILLAFNIFAYLPMKKKEED